MTEIATRASFTAFARMGYAARGVVYLVIGGLALLAAFGQGDGKTTDSKGAIKEILHQPFGNTLLVILVIGLCGYVCWRLMQAIKDTDCHGTSAKALVVRTGLFASAISHALLAFWTLRLLLNEGSDDKSQAGQHFLTTGAGQLVFGVAGAIFIGVGCAHCFKGWTARFERYMAIPADKNRWARPICRFGLIARGVVWCIVGWFFIRSALRAGSGETKGIADALNSLRDSAYGTWLFGIIAAGLFAFGLYSILEAIYRRIDTSSSN